MCRSTKLQNDTCAKQKCKNIQMYRYMSMKVPKWHQTRRKNVTVDLGKDQDLVNLPPPRHRPGKHPCGIKSPAGINRAQHDMRLFLHGRCRVYLLHLYCILKYKHTTLHLCLVFDVLYVGLFQSNFCVHTRCQKDTACHAGPYFNVSLVKSPGPGPCS